MTESKVILVTGANKGLGLETVKQLAKEGNTVIIGSRDKERGDAAVDSIKNEGISAEAIEIDLTNSSTVDEAVNYINEKHGKLDVLINNAGAVINEGWMGNSVETVSMNDLKETFEINFFATIDITRKFLPLVRKSNSGSIINVSSIMGSLEMHINPESPIYGSKPFAYDASKTALNQFTVHLAHALMEDNIKVYSAHPGWVKTDLGGEHAPLTVAEGAKTMVDLALEKTEFPSGSYVHLDSQLPW